MLKKKRAKLKKKKLDINETAKLQIKVSANGSQVLEPGPLWIFKVQNKIQNPGVSRTQLWIDGLNTGGIISNQSFHHLIPSSSLLSQLFEKSKNIVVGWRDEFTLHRIMPTLNVVVGSLETFQHSESHEKTQCLKITLKISFLTASSVAIAVLGVSVLLSDLSRYRFISIYNDLITK